MKTKRIEHIPDFLIIGAGKSGTTSLDNYLRQHPDLYMPPIKEPNFFGYETVSVGDLNDANEIRHYQRSVTDLASYTRLFEGATASQLMGETSNTYLYHKDAADRINYYNPSIKLIAVLRQPAERLWSRYLHLARDNRLPTQEFGDCLDKTSIWWRRNDLIPEGFYYKNLSKYYKLFASDQIRVYLHDELQKSSGVVLEDIFNFLEVDPEFAPDLKVRYNQSGFIKNKGLHHIVGNQGIIQKSAKQLLGSRYRMLKENIFLQKAVNYVRNLNLERPPMDPEIKSFLTHEVYGEDIRQLQRLTGRDLSHWLR